MGTYYNAKASTVCPAHRARELEPQCEVMILPPRGAMPHTELANREERRRKNQSNSQLV